MTPFAKPIVLFIDDEVRQLMIFSALLHMHFDIEVQCRQTLADGIEALQQMPIHLLIVDGMLPDGHGSSIVKQLRCADENWATHPAIPIVFSSAGALANEHSAGSDSPPSWQPLAVIPKPLSPNQLVDFVARYLPRRPKTTQP